jgi:steroid 5-alpha reductase family enzyme
MTELLHTYFEFFGASATTIAAYMICWFLVATTIRRNDVADIAWGLGFGLVAWLGALPLGDAAGGTVVLILSMVTIWSLRLSGHIFIRNRKKAEDPRYAQWRKDWGAWVVPRAFLQIFVLQGALLLLIASPIFVSIVENNSLNAFTLLGALVWVIGFVFEAGGDYQLSRFISKPESKGKIMTSGLWAYTRHPNYFGEVTQWWGVWIATLPSALWFIGIIGPITITFLLLKVSGIPMLEKRYDDNAEYQDYKRRTPAFFPWFPRS